jgi:hypothetical protein
MRKLMIALLVSAALMIIPGTALFSYDYMSAEMQQDLENVAKSFSELFGENIGSIAFIGDPVGYATVPHFEVGVTGGAVFVPIENINVDTDLLYDLGGLKYTPIPSIGAHLKFNLFGFELGAKLGGIPPFELSNDSYRAQIQSMVIGAKLRYRVLDKKLAVLRFGVSAGGFYEYTKGNLGLSMVDSFAVYEDVTPVTEGKEYIADLVTTSNFDTAWKGHTLGGEVQGNMKVLFINVFAGGRLSTSWGRATTTLDGDASAVVRPAYAGIVNVNPSETISVETETVPRGFDFLGFGGLEFKIMPLLIGARGGYNFSNRVVTLDIGARLQF